MRFAVPTETLLVWLLLVPTFCAVIIAWVMQRRRVRAELAFAERDLFARLSPGASRTLVRGKLVLLVLGVLALGVAAGRPQIGTRVGIAKRRGVDLMLALDVSSSMRAEDLRPNRLEKARREALSLVGLLDGDRVGVIIFAGSAFTQCPLTLDYGAASMLLSAVEPGVIPTPGTDLAGAIREATKALSSRPDRSKVLVVFTDGENHDSDPVAAAREAAEAGIRIYAIGLGSTSGEPIPVPPDEGGGYKRDRSGQIVMSRLDEPTLMDVASAGGGRYFRATDGERELVAIAEDLSRMEQGDLESRMLAYYEERFQIPLAAAIVLISLASFLPTRRKKRDE
jgi:Ca-activated chloride channel family protein